MHSRILTPEQDCLFKALDEIAKAVGPPAKPGRSWPLAVLEGQQGPDIDCQENGS